MRPDPIDLDSPLGISKREWIKVLGVNLALLLIVYTVALVCTLCGSDFFLLRFENESLQNIEATLQAWNVYPIVQNLFATVETFILSSYCSKRLTKWYWLLLFLALRIGSNVLFTQTIGYHPTFIPILMQFIFIVLSTIPNFKKERWWKILLRIGIAFGVSFIINGLIAVFRTRIATLYMIDISISMDFALNIEYYLAIALALGLLTLSINWEKGVKQCPEILPASGSSLNTKNSSPKPLKIATSNLPPKYRKRLRWLKAKVIAIQTIALIVIAALPWFTGRPVEFALVYASFCITRLMLGFNRSLHFKSELMCVTVGALCFWALTFLTPSVEVVIILSLCYGAGLALGFRLYWELHDLMMYHKAAKTDRYAMFYTVFKGNCDPKHINGVMRAKGYTDKDEIKIVQLYMAKEKVEYIAHYMTFAKITIEKKLTDIANDLYSRR